MAGTRPLIAWRPIYKNRSKEGRMLGNNDPVATVAVRDLDAAKKFYGDTLGLTALPSDEQEVLNFKSGHTTLLVYRSQFAGTNKATSVTWPVDDVEGIATTL